MLKEIMTKNYGLVSYIPNQYIFHQKSARAVQHCGGGSMVCIGKNIANCSKNPQFLPVMCVLVCYADKPPMRMCARWSGTVGGAGK